MILSSLNIFDFSNPTILNIWIASVSLFVSCIVLIYTYRTWRLKRGQSVRASLGISATNKHYVSNLIIENLKDRDLVIFGIYLKFGSNVYIDLLDIDTHFDSYHHIIPSLSTRIFELGPVLYYTEHSFEVDIEKLLQDWTAGTIILQTNIGKVKAKKIKSGWHPISQYFRNYGTHYIKAHRLYTREAVPSTHHQSENFIDYSSYDDRVRYVVTIKFVGEKTYDFEVPSSKNYIPFQKLNFTSEILSSVDTLRQYLIESRENNLIEFEDIVQIVNIAEIIQSNKDRFDLTPSGYTIQIMNKFQYHVIWKIKTLLYNFCNPPYPSKLYSIYKLLGIKRHRPTKRKNKPVIADTSIEAEKPVRNHLRNKRKKRRKKR